MAKKKSEASASEVLGQHEPFTLGGIQFDGRPFNIFEVIAWNELERAVVETPTNDTVKAQGDFLLGALSARRGGKLPVGFIHSVGNDELVAMVRRLSGAGSGNE